MDHGSFDRFVRLLGRAGSRRAALGALLGTSVATSRGIAEAAKKKDRSRNRKSSKKGKGAADVAAQAADCLNPGPSANLNGCNYADEDFSGDDLSSSSMIGTIFRNAELVGTDLSSSNMRGANFRGANLCGADLSSSQLRNADFRGFNPAMGGRVTNLTNADLHSSGCAGILTNQFTIFCNTIGCDGEVINPGCSGQCGPPPPPICTEPQTGTSCDCRTKVADGSGVCVDNVNGIGATCNPGDPPCPAGQTCAFSPCLNANICYLPCPSPDPCTCAPPADCADARKCGETAAARRSSGAKSPDKA